MFALGLKKKLSLANDNLRARFHRFVDCRTDSSRVLDTPPPSFSSPPSSSSSSSSNSSTASTASTSPAPFTPFSSLVSLPLSRGRYGRLGDYDGEEALFAEWEAAEAERAAVVEKEDRTRQMLAEALDAPRKAGAVLGLPTKRDSVYGGGMRAPRKAASVLGLSGSVGGSKMAASPRTRSEGEGRGESDDPFR